MSRRIEHRAGFAHPADVVYSTMVDADYLRARLAEIGGREAALLEHDTSGGSVRYHLRHGLDAKHLPSVVRGALGGDLSIDRFEQWRGSAEGGYAGSATVTVPGTPAQLTGDLWLADADGGCALSMDGTVSVSIPLVGGKLEETIARYVRELLDNEQAFTARWIAGRP